MFPAIRLRQDFVRAARASYAGLLATLAKVSSDRSSTERSRIDWRIGQHGAIAANTDRLGTCLRGEHANPAQQAVITRSAAGALTEYREVENETPGPRPAEGRDISARAGIHLATGACAHLRPAALTGFIDFLHERFPESRRRLDSAERPGKPYHHSVALLLLMHFHQAVILFLAALAAGAINAVAGGGSFLDLPFSSADRNPAGQRQCHQHRRALARVSRRAFGHIAAKSATSHAVRLSL